MAQITNKQIWSVLRDAVGELKSLCLLIRGDPDDHEDMGLIGDVRNNTKFRRTTTRFLWILIVAMTGLWGTIIAQTIINGGR